MSYGPVVLIHGGAGTWAKIEQDGVDRGEMEQTMKQSALAGHAIFRAGGTAVDAVVAAVAYMEDSPHCNAGRGSCLTEEGKVEMDASVMDGATLRLGGVGAITNVKNPVKVARSVMDESPHVLFCGEGANTFAKNHGHQWVATEDLVVGHTKARLESMPEFEASATKEFKDKQTPFKSPSDHDTVGAVAVDSYGNIAYATSTGGINAKHPGRVGDSPIGGCGGFADNIVGACSTTGTGEAILKSCLGRLICLYMEQGATVQEACDRGLVELSSKFGGSGGCIGVDKAGNVGIAFFTPGMGWAYTAKNVLHWGIYKGEKYTETLSQ